MHGLVYFHTFRKNGIMFCLYLLPKTFFSFLLVTEVKVFYLNDSPFCFWYRNIDVSNFFVRLAGGAGMGGVNCEANHEQHMFS